MSEPREYFAWWTRLSAIKIRVEAETAGKAKLIVKQRVEDAGYHPKWTELRAAVAKAKGGSS